MTGHPAPDVGGAGPDRNRPGIEADLVIEVDAGSRGRTSAHLSGSGRELTLRAVRPEVLVAAAGRRASGTLSELLGASGMRVELHGPGRRVAVLDPGRRSRVGAALGDPHLHVDPIGWRVLTRAATLTLAWPAALRGAGLVPVIGTAAVAAALVLRRHRRHDPGSGG